MDAHISEPIGSEPITVCLHQVSAGVPGAEERLFALVYQQLRKMAGLRMTRERSDHTLQATALANETYLRLIRTIRCTSWKDRAHFYASCALAMRNILIDHARRGKMQKVEIDLMPGIALSYQRSAWLIAFDEALSRLAAFDPRGARAIELTYFIGLTRDEVAEVVGVNKRTVQRDLDSGMRWIRRELNMPVAAVDEDEEGVLVRQ